MTIIKMTSWHVLNEEPEPQEADEICQDSKDRVMQMEKKICDLRKLAIVQRLTTDEERVLRGLNRN